MWELELSGGDGPSQPRGIKNLLLVRMSNIGDEDTSTDSWSACSSDEEKGPFRQVLQRDVDAYAGFQRCASQCVQVVVLVKGAVSQHAAG